LQNARTTAVMLKHYKDSGIATTLVVPRVAVGGACGTRSLPRGRRRSTELARTMPLAKVVGGRARAVVYGAKLCGALDAARTIRVPIYSVYVLTTVRVLFTSKTCNRFFTCATFLDSAHTIEISNLVASKYAVEVRILNTAKRRTRIELRSVRKVPKALRITTTTDRMC